MAIDHINLSRLDLNLLVALDALLAERSVTRAAARVGLGQSAMSHNLARLRALFGDELLTRAPEGMRPTPRALALFDPVRVALSQIQALVSRDEAFDPRTAERTFRVGLPDSVEVLAVPALLAHLCEAAPGIHLRLHTVDPSRLLDDLDADRWNSRSASRRSRAGRRTTSDASWPRTRMSACSTRSVSGFRPRSRSTITSGCRTCSPAFAPASAGWWTTRWRSSG